MSLAQEQLPGFVAIPHRNCVRDRPSVPTARACAGGIGESW
jgi:hypothetical protein